MVVRLLEKNPVIRTLLSHKSIRDFSDERPSDQVVKTIVRAGQQAPFATQCYSVLLSRNRDRNRWKAPLLFTVCVDSYKFERIMERRGWNVVMNDLALLLLAVQDSALMAENMVVAGRSMGLGSCFIGNAVWRAEKIAVEYHLPVRVLPLVQLAMGYPIKDPPPRPRYPLEFTLFEDEYPKFDADTISKAMHAMDEGYLAQDYYRKLGALIALQGDRREDFTYENYSWTEHMSRKLGQYDPDPKLLLKQLERCGFNITQQRTRQRKT
jgi:nitroreductase